MLKIYISGPITGIEDYRERFARAANRLISGGYEIVNPVEIGNDLSLRLDREPSYCEYMDEDIKYLNKCDAIYLLFGWRDSKGAKMELRRALELDLKIMEEELA